MLKEFLKAFLMIFIAELGDKTQLIAMTFATQFTKIQVLLGVGLGVFFNHGIAVILGQYLNTLISISKLQIFAGLLFIVLGLLSLRQDEDNHMGPLKKDINPILIIAIAFFIGELGDKTQLTAMTLSSESQWPFFVLIGTTLGLVFTSSLGIFLGSRLGNKIPEIYIKILSSVFFILIGLLKLFTWLPKKYLRMSVSMIYLIVVVVLEVYLIFKLLSEKHKDSQFKRTSQELYRQTEILSQAMDQICLGKDICKNCKGGTCIVGYTKQLLIDARQADKYDVDNLKYLESDKSKIYNEQIILETLSIILNDYIEHGFIEKQNSIVNIVKNNLEKILLGRTIDGDNIEDYLFNFKKIDIDKYKKIKDLLVIK